MRTLILPIILLCTAGAATAQYAVGTTARTFRDDARDRDIPCTIDYPADATGDDVPCAAGAFPVIVIGHGFVMTTDAYDYLAVHYAAAGYIVVRPSTEGGLLPDHAAFGQDLAFLPSAVQADGADGSALLFGHVGTTSAVLGHSMGGGAAVLAASATTSVNALVTLAPAETSPSAVAAASLVSAPALVLAASEDCVTPIAQHARPIYDALAPSCKVFAAITGGGHCYFGDNSFTCSLGEFTCGPDLTIDREQQHDIVLDLTDQWLDHFLRGSNTALTGLLDSLATSTRFVGESTCLSTEVSAFASASELRAYWDAATEAVRVDGVRPGDMVLVLDPLGRIVQHERVSSAPFRSRPGHATNGLLLVQVQREGVQRTLRVPVVH